MDAAASIEDVRRSPDRALVTSIALVVLVLVFFAISFLLGPSNLAPRQLISGLLSGEGARRHHRARDPTAARPLALVVGAALGASGAALRVFRNPLAEPGVTGVTSSAGLARCSRSISD